VVCEVSGVLELLGEVALFGVEFVVDGAREKTELRGYLALFLLLRRKGDLFWKFEVVPGRGEAAHVVKVALRFPEVY